MQCAGIKFTFFQFQVSNSGIFLKTYNLTDTILTLNNISIMLVSMFEYLGITLDPKLRWKQLTTKLMSKVGSCIIYSIAIG